MKYINRKFVWLILSFIVFSFQADAQKEKTVSKNSAEQAYQTLLKTDLFALGGTGYAGETSQGEEALEVLLEGEEPIEALKNLVRNASPEGGLYALFGLRALKCDCFDEEVKIFLARSETGERKGRGREKLGAGMVNRMTGCLGYAQTRVEVTEEIKTGKFDSYIEFKNKQKNRKLTPLQEQLVRKN
jgi:hypothetical protein